MEAHLAVHEGRVVALEEAGHLGQEALRLMHRADVVAAALLQKEFVVFALGGIDLPAPGRIEAPFGADVARPVVDPHPGGHLNRILADAFANHVTEFQLGTRIERRGQIAVVDVAAAAMLRMAFFP